jgi:hypothetical protein
MIDSQAEFLMEVTDKTKADIKVFEAIVTPLHCINLSIQREEL